MARLLNELKKKIKKKIEKFLCKRKKIVLKISESLCGKFQINLNKDLCHEQKTVLICYLNVNSFDAKNVFHANYLQAVQMVKCFIDLNYCVDVCHCDDDFAYEIVKDRKYDVVIGQGKNYKKICQEKFNKNAKKILYVTESLPSDVSERYKRRIDYFKQRHPSVDFSKSIVRNGYFENDMFSMSDYIIAMTSNYNVKSMKKINANVYTIKSNVIFNRNFVFDREINMETIRSNRKNFLWFGSVGLIHKGVDIAIDAIKEFEDCSLDFYGINPNEVALFNTLKTKNVNNCGVINVQSRDFVDLVAKKYSFLIFPSCSEGMSTAVATCMAHGIVPIVSKETGFESCKYIIELDDCCVETVHNVLKKILLMTDEEVLEMRKSVYDYACKNFSIESFDERFRMIMNEIECL